MDPIATALERDLQFAIRAASRAGRILVGLREAGRWEDVVLGDVGDQAADGYLQGLLEGRYPEDGVLSEETADAPDRLGRARVWIVDPLDGTKEFRGRREDWAVHVALTLDTRCALAAVALPARGQVLWGVALEGHQRAGIGGETGAASLVRGDSDPGTELRVVHSRSHTPPWMARFGQEIGATSVAGWGSAGFKVAQLVLGEADVYVHKIGLKEWDTCAPETVARSLGWAVCKLRGDEHRYNQENPRNHELVVCRPVHRDRVLGALEAAGALEAR